MSIKTPQTNSSPDSFPVMDVRALVIIVLAAGATVLCVYNPWIAVPIAVGVAVLGLLHKIISR